MPLRNGPKRKRNPPPGSSGTKGGQISGKVCDLAVSGINTAFASTGLDGFDMVGEWSPRSWLYSSKRVGETLDAKLQVKEAW
jgi:hypothetical protein